MQEEDLHQLLTNKSVMVTKRQLLALQLLF
jgi:hypothetical protein